MALKGKCKFCRSPEHNILHCNDESIKNITDNIEQTIFNYTIYNFKIMDKIFLIILNETNYSNECNTLTIIRKYIPIFKQKILDILQKLSKIDLSLLAKKNMIATSYPKSIHIYLLTNKYCKICEEESHLFINYLLYIYNTKNIYFLYDFSAKKIFLQFFWIYINTFYEKCIDIDPEEMITIFYDNLPSNLINTEYIYSGVNDFIELLFNNGYKFKYEDTRHIKRWKINSFLLCTEISNKNEFQCTICFEDFKEIDIITTKCNHTFCKECFEKTIEYVLPYKSLYCSMCRKSIVNINVKSVEIHNDFNIKYK